MSSLKEHLLAARAMIDTAEKWECRGRSIVAIFRDLPDDAFHLVKGTLTLAAGLRYQDRLIPFLFDKSHAEVIEVFDRAISSQEIDA